MDASIYKEHLSCLLGEEARAMSALESVLETEHQFILADNLEDLEKASTERDIHVSTLLRIDGERQSLCRAVGYTTDKDGLLKLINWCDPTGTLQSRWKQNTSAILNCRALNDRNGALINNRLKRVEGMLTTLTGTEHNQSRVYTARGNAYQNPQAGRVCHIQA